MCQEISFQYLNTFKHKSYHTVFCSYDIPSVFYAVYCLLKIIYCLANGITLVYEDTLNMLETNVLYLRTSCNILLELTYHIFFPDPCSFRKVFKLALHFSDTVGSLPLFKKIFKLYWTRVAGTSSGVFSTSAREFKQLRNPNGSR